MLNRTEKYGNTCCGMQFVAVLCPAPAHAPAPALPCPAGQQANGIPSHAGHGSVLLQGAPTATPLEKDAVMSSM